MSSERDDSHNFFNTSYRHDISSWGGKSLDHIEDLPDKVDIQTISEMKPSLRRQLEKVQAAGEVRIPETTTKSTFVPHMPLSRDVNPVFGGQVPPPMQFPDAPDESIFRMTTEYKSMFKGTPNQPLLANETIERCQQTRMVRERSVDQPTRAPTWETSYRSEYCNKVTDLHTTQAITTHNKTNLR